LVVSGQSDYQALPREAETLTEALKKPAPTFTQLNVARMNHLLRETNELSDSREYQTPGPVAPALRAALAIFC